MSNPREELVPEGFGTSCGQQVANTAGLVTAIRRNGELE
jgi:hypothetical protein